MRKGSSPWGAIQDEREILPGIVSVSTAGHGGIIVSAERLEQMPDYMRVGYAGRGAFEEDCDWAIPFCVFEAEIREKSTDEYAIKNLDDGTHLRTLRDWHWRKYETFYGVTLEPGESHGKDEDTWKLAHARDLQVVSAWGSDGKRVMEGWTGVCACVGGRSANGHYAGEIRYFMVPASEYAARGPFGFVVDPARHTEVPDFTKREVA